MKSSNIVLSLIFGLGLGGLNAQVSPDCANAVPVCNDTPVNGGTDGFGTDDFYGVQMSGCLEETATGAIESNSAWYRFRTGASGQLGFNIGIDTSEDWDFALYKSNDCSNLGEPVRCNFFDNQDESAFIGVGEDPSGDTENVQYADWLQVSPGEDYYLLINNFSIGNSGFSIQFSGTIFVTNPYDALDCSIIDNLLGPPISACENSPAVIDATTNGAIAYNWFLDIGAGFQPISGVHDPTLQVSVSATYRVEVILPSNNNIISEVQVAFSPQPSTYPVSDDVSCSDMSVYDLSQKDLEALGGQNLDEFVVSYHASMADATNGTNVLPKQYNTQAGSQTLYVRVSSIDNPDCFDVSQQFELVHLETPILDFPSEVFLCEDSSSVNIGVDIPNTNYTYNWNSGETSANIPISRPGSYTLTATNSQSGISCTSSRTVAVIVSKPPQIRTIEIEDLQNNNVVTVLTDVEGDFEYRLDDHLEYQSENTFTNVAPGIHTVTVNDSKGCGEVTEEIVVVGFPKFFTPNGDGANETWHIAGISNLENPIVSIYDRFGKLLTQLKQNTNGWDGTQNGRRLPSSDYWFKLEYTDTNGQQTTAKYINNHFSLRR